jgi:tripartite-type tricarboxylate transporter receptor subunit TctC
MRLSSYSKMYLLAGFLVVFLALFPQSGICQTYPDKPITIYCGFATGATTDLTVRALASGAEKLLGVPMVVENKPAAGGTVAATMATNKKPDGYTLIAVSTGALALRPHLLKLAYDPFKDFTMICQYARFSGALAVLKNAPFKNIDEFITYAKSHPGLSYSSAGMYGTGHLGVELLRQCKGLEFKHVPTKGGTEASTQLLGKHVDFMGGSGIHIQYVKQDLMRMLVLFGDDKRDPDFPDVPTLNELGCKNAPPYGYTVLGPKGMPDAIYKKLSETFKKVAEGPGFQKALANLGVSYEYKDGSQLEKDVRVESEFYKDFLEKTGAMKKK